MSKLVVKFELVHTEVFIIDLDNVFKDPLLHFNTISNFILFFIYTFFQRKFSLV